MAKKVNLLTSFVKPAAPNSKVLNLAEANTQFWMNRNLDILKEHYTDLLQDLSFNLDPFSRDAYDRAINWARQRYHKKLTPSSMDLLLEPVLNPDLPGEGAAACPVGNRISWLEELLDSMILPYSSISNTRTTQTIRARQSHTTLQTR
ncbi:hypothetical protein F7725_006223 [Dissostichus mawsoni]|uniref:Uncharacterized protein n=1 Tax=Dissostichus mawsoni TaxID=36200 RepID=A0A7J5YXL6_DISMA|nr:hypothetical protein F7725_006223 [Dissostichus mawsoni]